MRKQMKNIFRLFFPIIFTLATMQHLCAQWVQTNGPIGGDITCFAMSGTTLVAGDGHLGIFLSADNGATWTLSNIGLASRSVAALAVSGTNLFAGTIIGGVYLSTNNGASWTPVNSGLTNTSVRDLIIFGTSLFAGTSGGVFRSDNNGANWTAVNTGLTNTGVNAFAVSGTSLFAGTSGGVFRSDNNGTSWTAVNTGLTTTHVYALAVSGTNLFAGTAGGGVFISGNNGSTWTAVNTGGLQGTYIMSFAISGRTIFAGARGSSGVFRSDNDGANWTPVNTGLTNGSINALAVYDTNLFAGTEGGGVFRSLNNGENWMTANAGLIATHVYALAVSGEKIFSGTTGAGVALSANNGTSWAQVNTGLTNIFVYKLVVSGTNLFAGTGNGGGGGGGLSSSTNYGTSWTKFNIGMQGTPVTAFVTFGTNYFAGTYSDGVYLSTNNGASWTPVNSGLTNTSVRDLVIFGKSLFAGTSGGVFRSDNNGANWTAVNTGLTNTDVNAFAVIDTSLFAGTSSGVFVSTNNGSSWTPVNTGLPNRGVNAFAVTGTNLFAGTSGGVYLSANNGVSWSAVDAGLTGMNILSLAASGTNLYAGTWYSGVWRRPLSEMIADGGCTAVTISSQPQSQTVAAGSKATFNVSVNGTGPFLYFWYKNGIQISGTNNSSYTTIPLTSSDNGNSYKCIVTNCNNMNQAVSTNAVLTVTGTGCAPITISSHPQSRTIAAGNTSTFNVTVTGSAPFTYSWYKNNSQIPGATSAAYTTGVLDATDNGSVYKCIITNCNGANQLTSSGAVLTVTGSSCTPITITSQPQSKTQPVGSQATFSVSVSGTAPFTYSWYKNNALIPGATQPYYATDLLSLADNGSLYKCVISNCSRSSQATSSNAVLTVVSNENSLTFYHQIPTNKLFSARRLLFNSETGIGSPKICCDGTSSTVVRFESIGLPAMRSLNFRIKENSTGKDAEHFGSFGAVQAYADSIVSVYTHPLIVENDGVKNMITIQVYNSETGQIFKELPIDIYRAPVLMVHGLWSDATTFGEMENALFVKYYPASILRKANYQSTNASSFNENRNIVLHEINALMLDALERGYSCGKVDIVAHSMGGLLSRLYIQSPNYAQNINRLITMNTPHSGSQVANLLLKDAWNIFLIRKAFDRAGKYVSRGAVNDLQINSEAIQNLRNGEIGSPVVPKRAMATTTSVLSGIDEDVFELNLVTNMAFTTPLLIFNTEDNDLLVPLSSQIGGLASGYYTYDFVDLSHSQSIRNREHINILMELLKKNPHNSNYFTTAPFNPPPLEESTSLHFAMETSAPALEDSARVMISGLADGTTVFPGQKMDITIESYGEMSKILFAASTQQGQTVSEVMESNSGIFQYTVPMNAGGTINVLAMGRSVTGTVSIDTIQLNVTVSAGLDSISVTPKQMTLPKSQSANISVKGYYSDGSIREISKDPNLLSISTDSHVATMLSQGLVLADSIGFADMNIAYFGKTDHLSVTVLPSDAFITGIGQGNKEAVIGDYELFQNYPNPFNPNTTVRYSIPRSSIVKIQIFDVLGREVATIVNEMKSAGTYSATFNASTWSSGIYFCRLQSGSFMATKKLILLR